MKKKKDSALALEIACRMASLRTDNFGDSLVESAKIYQELTGEDLGIKDLERTNRRVKRKAWWKNVWRKIIHP